MADTNTKDVGAEDGQLANLVNSNNGEVIEDSGNLPPLQLNGKDLANEPAEEAADETTKAEEHSVSNGALEEELEQTKQERDEAKRQLEAIIGKLSGMKSMFQNYKATQEELNELKEQSSQWSEKQTELELENSRLDESVKTLTEELKNLNSECDRLSASDSEARKELQLKEQELQDEKYRLENELRAAQKAASGQKLEYSELSLAKEELEMENRNLRSIIDELKTKVADKEESIQKQGRRTDEVKAEYEQKFDALRLELEEIKGKNEELTALTEKERDEKEEVKRQLERVQEEAKQASQEALEVQKLKDEIHSKSIIIGKLRHEAIILNEHLTKSLGMLRLQLSNEDNAIDKELISNVILNFLQIPRGDAKKFEALQLISVLLEWDEQRKIQAGLAHGSNKNKGGESRARNFVSLWTDFLEKESTKSNSG